MLQSTLWPNKHIAPFALLAVLLICPVQLSAGIITFASGTDWDVFNADPGSPGAVRLGGAANICLNSDSLCAPGATNLNFLGRGWLTDLGVIPQATWIWANGITGSTSPADLQQYYFSKTISVASNVESAKMWAAGDDLVEIQVNGGFVGRTGSIINPALSGQASLAVFDILPFLRAGDNTITVHAQNGPAFFAGCALDCSYAVNPAGAVFGGIVQVLDEDGGTGNPEPQSVLLVVSAGLAFLGSKFRRRLAEPPL